MKLFLLPISTRRTLLYCQKIQVLPTAEQTRIDKLTIRATKLWADWERKESGWQKKVVEYGNRALRRIPYEEWGLKSVPPLSTRRREEEVLGKDKNQLVYPETVIPTTKAIQVLRSLGTEREGLHKRRLIWCLVGMPISAPFALVPVVPNLPFFYLVYRAWSHWRAHAGGKHIQFLVSNNLLSIAPSKVLDSIYPALLPSSPTPEQSSGSPDLEKPPLNDAPPPVEEQLLLTQQSGKELVKALDVPELEVELERAIWQVENAIRKEKEALKDKQAEAKASSGASTTSQSESNSENR